MNLPYCWYYFARLPGFFSVSSMLRFSKPCHANSMLIAVSKTYAFSHLNFDCEHTIVPVSLMLSETKISVAS